MYHVLRLSQQSIFSVSQGLPFEIASLSHKPFTRYTTNSLNIVLDDDLMITLPPEKARETCNCVCQIVSMKLESKEPG